jgi:hypothetical protein
LPPDRGNPPGHLLDRGSRPVATALPPAAVDKAVALGNAFDRQDAAGVRELLRLAGGLTHASVVY